MEDILIMHLEYGKDFFISVSGSYIRTCFGNSLEWLSRLDRPTRLWSPDDDEDDQEDDDSSTLYDPYNVLGTKSSMGSIRDRDSQDVKQLKSVKSQDSLSRKSTSSVELNMDKESKNKALKNTRSAEKLVAKKRPVRQLSLPKDLWRIVDFVYKHGLLVVRCCYFFLVQHHHEIAVQGRK